MVLDAQTLGHFFVQETFAGTVGLHPFAVNDKLRDGTLARLPDHFLGGSGVFSISISWKEMSCCCRKRLASRQSGHQKAVDSDFHRDI